MFAKIFTKLFIFCVLVLVAMSGRAQPTSSIPDVYTHGCQVGIGIVHMHLRLFESYKHEVLVGLCQDAYDAIPNVRKEYTELDTGHDKFGFACGIAMGVGLSVYKRQDIIANEATLAVLAQQCLDVAVTLQKNGYFNNEGVK